MKKMIILSVLILVIVLSLASCKKDEVTDDEKALDNNEVSNESIDIEKIAVSFVEDLVNERYEDAYNKYTYDEKMKSAVNDKAYKNIMEQLYASMGKFKSIVKTEKTNKDPYEIVAVVTEFENDYLNLNVVFDKESKIAGFNFTESNYSSEIDKNKDDFNFEESEVTVGEGDWELPGTLTIPNGEGPFPAVVLVHGSGPNDRDETYGPNKTFRDIAWGLADKGVAVLRYDKRTKVHMNKILENMDDFTVKEEVIDDALEAVNLLKNKDKIDGKNIYVLGHSLGGYLVPMVGVEDKDIKGFVILAGSTRPLEDLILEQVGYLSKLDGTVSEEEQKQIDALKIAVDKIKSRDLDENAKATELMGINAKYWLSLRNYKPTELVKELNRPILVLQGERDYQVTMKEFNNWKNALSDDDKVVFKTYDKLNHLFLPGEGEPNPNEYAIKSNVPDEVMNDISEWIINNK